MPSLSGKVALVTGAARGIGEAIVCRLVRDGAAVMMTDLDTAAGQTLASKLRAEGADVRFETQDVADAAQWQRMMERVTAQWGRLDILVNNAGISMFGLVTDLSLEDWRRCIAVDLDSVFFGTKYALPLIRSSGGGSIVNISSMAGITGQANLSAYCAAKGGVRMFTKAVALECAAARDGVRVNSIHPGIIDTPIFHTVAPDAAIRQGAFGQGPSIDVQALAAAVTPLGVPGRPADVAGAVAYLVSDDARFVTGTELIVDGGFCAA